MTCAALLLVFLGAFAPHLHAATGQIESIVVTRSSSDEPIEVLGAMLHGQLSRSERRDFYDVVLGRVQARSARPEGDLGPAYELTYILEDVGGAHVQIQQTAYLEADPPVVFTPEGQSYEFYPHDIHPVSSGWRQLPIPAAAALAEFIRERSRGPEATMSAFGVVLIFVATLLIAGIVVTLLRSRWHARRLEERARSDDESVVVTRGSRSLRVLSVVSLLAAAVVLYFVGLGMGYGYQTCSGGRVIERLPDGTPKTIIGPFQCSQPDYWPWLYIVLVAYALALSALILTVISIRRWVRT